MVKRNGTVANKSGHRLLRTALPLAVALIAGGCDSSVLNSYSEYHHLNTSGWSYTDIETFTPVHADSICPGRLVIGLRHSGSYPYTSVSVEVAYTDNGTSVRDTIEVPLSDSYGRWLGTGIGTTFQITDTVGRLLHASGSEVKIRHAMRCDTLHGIDQLGIFFLPD